MFLPEEVKEGDDTEVVGETPNSNNCGDMVIANDIGNREILNHEAADVRENEANMQERMVNSDYVDHWEHNSQEENQVENEKTMEPHGNMGVQEVIGESQPENEKPTKPENNKAESPIGPSPKRKRKRKNKKERVFFIPP